MMGRREASSGAMKRLWAHTEGDKLIYVNCRIENKCGSYRHYDRVQVTEIDGKIVETKELPELNTLVRI